MVFASFGGGGGFFGPPRGGFTTLATAWFHGSVLVARTQGGFN